MTLIEGCIDAAHHVVVSERLATPTSALSGLLETESSSDTGSPAS